MREALDQTAALRVAVVLLGLLIGSGCGSDTGKPPILFELGTIPGRVLETEGSFEIDSPSVLADPKHFVWGGSAVQGDDGRFYMFYSLFDAGPQKPPFQDAWLLSSKIACAVSDLPDRDFEFVKIVLAGASRDGHSEAWDARGVHNPHIKKFGDRYYLYYIGSRDPGLQPPGSPGETLRARDRIQQVQKIGVIEAGRLKDLIDGRFERPTRPLLSPRTRVKADRVVDPSPAGTAAKPDNLIVVNPSVTFRPTDGKYLLYFKGNLYDPQWRGVHGLAVGDSPIGPFQARDEFVFDIRMPDGRLASAEDPYVWYHRSNRLFYAVIKDFTAA